MLIEILEGFWIEATPHHKKIVFYCLFSKVFITIRILDLRFIGLRLLGYVFTNTT